MIAELLKLRLLPLPRVLLAVCLGLIAVVALIVFVVAPDAAADYRDAPIGMAWVSAMVGSIVLGSWVMGVDFSQGTLRRVLIAEPQRSRVIVAKFATVIAGTAVLTAALAGFALASGWAVATAASVDYGFDDAVRSCSAIVLQGTLIAAFAGSVTLLLRSFAGGMVAAFAVLFVIDNLLQLWPRVANYTFNSATFDLVGTITGENEPTLTPTVAALTAIAWIAAVAVPAALRFQRSDFK